MTARDAFFAFKCAVLAGVLMAFASALADIDPPAHRSACIQLRDHAAPFCAYVPPKP